MELKSIPPPEKTGKLRIELSPEVNLLPLRLFEAGFEGDSRALVPKPLNIVVAKREKIPMIDKPFDINKIARLVQDGIFEESKNKLFYIGKGPKRRFCGPVLHVVTRESYLIVNGNKATFHDSNPLDERQKFIGGKNNQIAITPSDVTGKDFLLVCVENGCIVVSAGGFIVFDLPIVLIKSNGNYFTISEGIRNIFKLKNGIHFIAYTNDYNGYLPVVFAKTQHTEIRSKQSIETELSVKKEEKLKTLKLIDHAFIPNTIQKYLTERGYEIDVSGDYLGIGPYSLVKSGQNVRDKKDIAVKIIISDPEEVLRREGTTPKELSFVTKLNHENIVKAFDCICLSEIGHNIKQYSFVFMEKVAGSMTIDKLMDNLSQTDSKGKIHYQIVLDFIKQIAYGVSYLHSNHIAHCNLNLEKYLINGNNVKICGFGRALKVNSKDFTASLSHIGTLALAPPEFIADNQGNLMKADIWMMGISLYSMLTGNRLPFGDITLEDMVVNSQKFIEFRNKQKLELPLDTELSSKANDLISLMANVNPKERISASLI